MNKLAVLLLLVCVPQTTYAEMYKCIASGRTVYSSSPCGADAKIIQDRVTVTNGQTLPNIQAQASRDIPPQNSASQIQVNVPVQVNTTTQVILPTLLSNCDYQEAEVEKIRKAMREGYPANKSNYWHERKRNADDDYDSCRKKLAK